MLTERHYFNSCVQSLCHLILLVCGLSQWICGLIFFIHQYNLSDGLSSSGAFLTQQILLSSVDQKPILILHSLCTHNSKISKTNCKVHQFGPIREVFSRGHATLHLAMSVGWYKIFLNPEQYTHCCSSPTVRDSIAVYPALFSSDSWRRSKKA